MKDLFNFFGKKKELLTPEEKRNKAIVSLGIYGLFFLFFIVLALIGDNTAKENGEKNNNINTQILEKYEVLKNNNFDSKITLIADSDILLVNLRRESDTREIITKKHRDEIKYYYRNENIYYETDQDFTAVGISENIRIYNEYDETFLSINNIFEFIKDNASIELAEEEYNIVRYKIDAIKMLDIYNDINNTQFATDESFEVVIDIYYNLEIEKIDLNLTKIYNIIKGTSYDKVSYTLEFNDISNINLPNINISFLQ